MTQAEEFMVHSASDSAHKSLLSKHSALLLELAEKNRVRLFTKAETVDGIYEPFLVDPTTGAGSATGVDIGLNIKKVHEHLETQWMGQVIVYCREIPSTQNVIQRTFCGLDAGCVAVSGYQTGGRGRRGTTWVSPAGGIAISMDVRVPAAEPERLTFVQYLAAMAAVDAIRMEKNWEHVPLRIKWPNDVYVRGSKIGGVLCEAVLRGGEFHIVVGIGVNITNPEPTTCLSTAISECGVRVDGARRQFMREIFLGHYLTAFERLFDEFSEQGFEGRLKERYLASWLHTDQTLSLGSADGPKGVVTGLAPNGWVRVYRKDLNAFQDLAPDLSSLDVQESVVREKVGGR